MLIYAHVSVPRIPSHWIEVMPDVQKQNFFGECATYGTYFKPLRRGGRLVLAHGVGRRTLNAPILMVAEQICGRGRIRPAAYKVTGNASMGWFHLPRREKPQFRVSSELGERGSSQDNNAGLGSPLRPNPADALAMAYTHLFFASRPWPFSFV